MTDNLGDNGLKLNVGKVLANATMTASTEGKVGGCGTLADETVAVIDLLLFLLVGLGNSRGVGGVDLPSVRVPEIGVGEVGGIGSTDTRGGEKVVGGGNDIFGSGNSHG